MDADPAGGVVAAPSQSRAAHRLMREVNRSLVLDVLREGGEMSRVQLACRTRLSKPTVSAIVGDLLRDGVVRDMGLGHSQARGGRPPGLLAYNDSVSAYAGIHVATRRTRIAVADGLGRVLADDVMATRTSADAREVLSRAADALRRTLARAHLDVHRLAACGVTYAGIADTASGERKAAREIGWHDVDVRGIVQDLLGVVVVVAPAIAAATLAEGRLTNHREGTYVHVHAGRSISAGIVVDGVLVHGHVGRAGDLAHCRVAEGGPVCSCGNRGCLDALASCTRERERAATALSHGDDGAREVRLVRDAGRMLGRGVAHLVNLLDPAAVIVSGPLLQAGDAYLDAVRTEAAARAPGRAVTIEPARLGSNAPVLGIVQMAMLQATPSFRIVGRATSR